MNIKYFLDKFYKKVLIFFVQKDQKNYIKLFKKFFFGAFKKSFALNNLDVIINKYLNYNNGYYVEIGANDGFNQSNSLYFEIYKNWNGVLIEPLKDKFLDLKKCRSSKKNQMFNNICAGFDFKNKNVEIINMNLMSLSKEINNSLNIEGHIKKYEARTKKNTKISLQKVEVLTLNRILEIANAPHLMDILFLDTEGSELEVLKGINFKKYNFKFMCIEVRNQNEIENFLKKYNYELVKKISHHDFLFKYMN
tara:strand:+ start:753 stop:1505 length:753 start_codon:yes stop_codon:yes gene_type:complete